MRHAMFIRSSEIEHSSEIEPVLAWNRSSNAETHHTLGRAVADLLFTREARQGKIQFAPHRLVGSYAEYRKLNAGKGPFFR